MAKGEKTIVTNRKARFEYAIEDELEAGISLLGTEVKSLRDGKANLQEAYCEFKGQSLFLRHLHIAPYKFGSYNNHDEVRPRQLLMHRAELDKWSKAVSQKGYTIVPLRVYFKEGKCKVRIGLGKGKKLHDKRHAIAERDSKRRMDRETARR